MLDCWLFVYFVFRLGIITFVWSWICSLKSLSAINVGIDRGCFIGLCLYQGGRPSPFDRNLGTKMAAKCAEKLIQQIQESYCGDGELLCWVYCLCLFFFVLFVFFYFYVPVNSSLLLFDDDDVAGIVHTKRRDTATLLGLVKRQSAFTPVEDLKPRADFESVFQHLINFVFCFCLRTSVVTLAFSVLISVTQQSPKFIFVQSDILELVKLNWRRTSAFVNKSEKCTRWCIPLQNLQILVCWHNVLIQWGMVVLLW